MTVGELKKALEGVPDQTEVWMGYEGIIDLVDGLEIGEIAPGLPGRMPGAWRFVQESAGCDVALAKTAVVLHY